MAGRAVAVPVWAWQRLGACPGQAGCVAGWGVPAARSLATTSPAAGKRIVSKQKPKREQHALADADKKALWARYRPAGPRRVVLTPEERQRREVLKARWQARRATQSNAQSRRLQTQQRLELAALEELRLLSEELYQSAVAKDLSPFPLQFRPVTETPTKDEHRQSLLKK